MRPPMRFSLSSTGLQEWTGAVLAVGLPQGDVEASAAALEPVSYTHLTLPTTPYV